MQCFLFEKFETLLLQLLKHFDTIIQGDKQMFKRDDILYFVMRKNHEIVRLLVEKVLANGMVYVINPKNTYTYWLTDKDLDRAFHTEIEAVKFVESVSQK